VFLMGGCGMGKSALDISILDEVKKAWAKSGRNVIAARSTTTETEQRTPLRYACLRDFVGIPVIVYFALSFYSTLPTVLSARCF
jgi:hypothetical protein